MFVLIPRKYGPITFVLIVSAGLENEDILEA
eukprot:COSAG05_NODE_2345_length_3199_cov_1.827419_4_plen_30_part_01